MYNVMAVKLKRTCIYLLVFIIFAVIITTVTSEEQLTFGSEFTSVVEILPTEDPLLYPNVKYTKSDKEEFHVFCYQNVPKSVFQIWRSVQLELSRVPPNFKTFHGENKSEVFKNYKDMSIWNPSSFLFASSDSVIEFPAFSNYCIGIATSEQYSFHLKVRTINYWKVLQTLLGIFLFLAAPDLSRNTFFHYAAGITFGVLASFLILLYFISRFIPQKGASYAMLVFGYSFVLYFIKVVWHHFHDIVTQYMDFVCGYCVIAAILSFVVCYRIGPVKNERTCNLIQWSMQALSLLLIFFSSEYREVSTAVILLLLTIRIIPIRWIKWAQRLWYRCFPPKIKLLTELEYIEQGHTETKNALESLRQYCNSPDCKVWKVVRNLKDPVRFANFIETGSHYTDEELLDYNSDAYDIIDENGTLQYLHRNTEL